MKNSFHSNNFICLINATSQALTISNVPPQLPVSITFPAVPKGASKKLYPSDFLRLSNWMKQQYLLFLRPLFNQHIIICSVIYLTNTN